MNPRRENTEKYYLLDGNNIVKSTDLFMEEAGGSFVKAQNVLAILSAKKLLKKNDYLFVFFDGSGFEYRFPPPRQTKVIFGKSKSADQLITAEIKKHYDLHIRKGVFTDVTVVSDDREIRECAKIFGATSWRTQDFIEKLFPKAGKKPVPVQKKQEKTITFQQEEKITDELARHYGLLKK